MTPEIAALMCAMSAAIGFVCGALIYRAEVNAWFKIAKYWREKYEAETEHG